MSDEKLIFDMTERRPAAIKVIGVGGGGTNAVNHMFRQGIYDVDYIVCNTDQQSLMLSPVNVKVQIGKTCLKGLGAGKDPKEGRRAAIEDLEEVMRIIGADTNMLFITAGMGGGTGTGAAPVIARAAKEAGILTVGIVTMPFKIEGLQRINKAVEGLNELAPNVDALLVIHNEKLRETYGNLGYSVSFSLADEILTKAAKGIAEIVTRPAHLNVDFNDVRNILAQSGIAFMSSATAEGDGRAKRVIEEGLSSPLLNYNDISGAKGVLLKIVSGTDEITLDEISDITNRLHTVMDKNANFIWGISTEPEMGNAIGITIIAAGFDRSSLPELQSGVSISSRPESSPLIMNRRQQTESPATVSLIDQSADEAFIPLHRVADELPAAAPDNNKAAERLHQLKEMQNAVKPRKSNHSNMRKNIDELENVPAYMRNKSGNSKAPDPARIQASKYSLFDFDDKGVILKPDNPYLDPRVD